MHFPGMAHSLAESGLHDFLDSFLAHPLEFQAKQQSNAFLPHQQVQTPLERDFSHQVEESRLLHNKKRSAEVMYLNAKSMLKFAEMCLWTSAVQYQ